MTAPAEQLQRSVHAGGKDVGVITYGLSSDRNGYSVAIARLDPSEVTDAGNKAKALGQNLSWDRFADVVLGLPLATEPKS